MNTDTKDKLKAAAIVVVLMSLLLYGFYVHRDDPHWFETKHVKVK